MAALARGGSPEGRLTGAEHHRAPAEQRTQDDRGGDQGVAIAKYS